MAWLLQGKAAHKLEQVSISLYMNPYVCLSSLPTSSPIGFSGKKPGTEIPPALRENRYCSLWEPWLHNSLMDSKWLLYMVLWLLHL